VCSSDLPSESALDIANAVGSALDAIDDDPNETDIPEVYGPEGAFDETTAAASESAAKTAPVEASQAPAEAGAPTPESAAGSETEPGSAKKKPASRLIPLLAKIGAIASPAQSIAIKVADIMAIPLARISVDKRDMLSWFAIITLFNALGVFVVFVLLR